jgi:N-acyl-D-amino-acid deacylase
VFDLVLKGGKVFTGAGNPWFKGDVAIKDGVIAEIGFFKNGGKEVIEVEGLAVAPGFIDIHDHSDFTILANREADSKVHMGVSTIVYASCGGGAAPLNEDMRKEITSSNSFLKNVGVDVRWSTMKEYLDFVESNGISVNVVPLVGFGAIRKFVMGMEMREPSILEMQAMKDELRKAMNAGCRGITTGLRYAPQSFATTEEIIELCKVVAKNGGFYTSHLRDEGDRGDPVGAIEEIIRIGRETELPVNISHFKILSKKYWDILPLIIGKVELARAEGIQITADQYPYRASGTGLEAWVPKWSVDGGRERFLMRLKDQETADRIKKELAQTMDDRGGPEAALISSYPLNSKYVGKNIFEISESLGLSPIDCSVLLLKDHIEAVLSNEIKGSFSIVNFNQNEENVSMIMQLPWVAVGSDSRINSPNGALQDAIPTVHPRYYGTFPRVLSKFSREKGIIRISEAIRKMTSLPAQILNLIDRGLLLPGNAADIVVFDIEKVQDTADYSPAESTKLYPEGIIHLVVNGVLTLKDGEHTGALAGKILRKKIILYDGAI